MRILHLVGKSDAKQASRFFKDGRDSDVILKIKAGAELNELSASRATNHQQDLGRNAPSMNKQINNAV